MNERAERVADVLQSVSSLLRLLHARSRGRKPLLTTEITMMQLRALAALSAHDGMTHRQLADALGIRPPATTALVSRLIEDGLVQRTPDEVDRRTVWVRPTKKGERLYERLLSTGRAIVVEALAGCSRSDLEAIEDGLERLAAALEQSVAVIETTSND